jgi:hypothetical protein
MIYQVTPLDKPFFSMTGDRDAENTFVEWPFRNHSTRNDNAQIEGDTHTASAPTLPSKAFNILQIQKKTFKVTNSLQAVAQYGIDDAMGDQFSFALEELGTDCEHALLRGSVNSGNASDTARRMQGLINAITTNKTTAASGITLSESIFKSFLQLIWTNSGMQPNVVLVHGPLKQLISGFTENVTRYEETKTGVASRTIRVYQGDFTEVEIHTSRDMLNAVNGRSMVAFNPQFMKKRWLRYPSSKILAETSDSMDGVVIHEASLEFGPEKASGAYLSLN